VFTLVKRCSSRCDSSESPRGIVEPRGFALAQAQDQQQRDKTQQHGHRPCGDRLDPDVQSGRCTQPVQVGQYEKNGPGSYRQGRQRGREKA
jgi:hypothetical protein